MQKCLFLYFAQRCTLNRIIPIFKWKIFICYSTKSCTYNEFYLLYDFQLLKEIQGFDAASKLLYLRTAYEGTSIDAVVKKIKADKQSAMLRARFIQLTSSANWDRACQKYPWHTDMENLNVFKGKQLSTCILFRKQIFLLS